MHLLEENLRISVRLWRGEEQQQEEERLTESQTAGGGGAEKDRKLWLGGATVGRSRSRLLAFVFRRIHVSISCEENVPPRLSPGSISWFISRLSRPQKNRRGLSEKLTLNTRYLYEA